jgi:hypothetical protein
MQFGIYTRKKIVLTLRKKELFTVAGTSTSKGGRAKMLRRKYRGWEQRVRLRWMEGTGGMTAWGRRNSMVRRMSE